MKKVKTNGIGGDASSAVPKGRGRCGAAIERDEFCLGDEQVGGRINRKYPQNTDAIVGRGWQVKRVHFTDAKDSQ